MTVSQLSTWPSGTFAAHLLPSSCADLFNLSAPCRVPAGTVVIRQGEPSSLVYVLRSTNPRTIACAKISALLENGHEGLFGIRVSGDLLGELGVVRSVRRSATVTTCTPALVHAFGRDVFLDFLSRHTDAWRAISFTIADRLDWANQRRLEFSGHDVLTRVARILILLAERHGRPTPQGLDLGIPLSQEEVGRLIGAHRDAVVKALSYLRQQDLIETSYRRTTITHPENLRQLAQVTS